MKVRAKCRTAIYYQSYIIADGGGQCPQRWIEGWTQQFYRKVLRISWPECVINDDIIVHDKMLADTRWNVSVKIWHSQNVSMVKGKGLQWTTYLRRLCEFLAER